MKTDQHCLTISDMKKETLLQSLTAAEAFFDTPERIIKSEPLLQGKTIATLFFEPSTRTRCSFEIAAKRLSANVITLDTPTSAVVKGETVIDTILTLQAMQVQAFVIRHAEEGMAEKVAEQVDAGVSVINAGDGCHAHPTQALLDMLTIRQHKPDFSSLSVAIVGDVRHSRVARSDLQALRCLGVTDIRVIAPKPLLPENADALGIQVYHEFETGLRDVDVIMTLRLQRERMLEGLIPDTQTYHAQYGVTSERVALAKPDAIVMHPGPINRGVEISSEVADGAQSVIAQQVTNGVVVRMAVMHQLLSSKQK